MPCETPSVDFDAIGRRLKSAREAQGKTQADLAYLSKVNGGTISKVENGKSPEVTASSLAKLADALGVSLGWLLTGSESDHPPPPEFGKFAQTAVAKRAPDAHVRALASIAWPPGVRPTVGLYKAWLALLSAEIDPSELDDVAEQNEDTE